MKCLAVSDSLQVVDVDLRNIHTIADAMEILRNLPRFRDDMRVEVRIHPWSLPCGQKTGLGQLICKEQGRVVPLPSARYFYGIRTRGQRPERFDISCLDRAVVDSECNVRLSRGDYLHAVFLQRSKMPNISTELQKRILELTIQFIGAEEQCYVAAIEFPEGTLRFTEPVLDYRTLLNLELPKLDAIVAHIHAADWTLRRLSRQTIANTLAAAGVRPISTRRDLRP